ncbi:MAG: tetratricopeptide repeat protein, partial [Candidatus Gastranaerophilales bacterium]|nr:tetratricopeptide repeat protein [Candidatus Gastranaerophilales bacterium]
MFSLIVLGVQCTYAIDTITGNGDISLTRSKTEYGRVQYGAKEFKKNIESITGKFSNLNIKSAYDDMYRLIMDNEGNDYYLLLLADKAAGLGFFDLANLAFSKISDFEIASLDSENTHKLFFPKYKLNRYEVIALAEAFSNIQYNDRSNEAIKDITSNITSLAENDYANYILALAYLKLDDIDNAKKYILSALNINSGNLNYKILQSQVIASTKKGKKALKLVKETKKNKAVAYYPIKNKIDANEEYIKYKTEKQPWLKDYHLGYYYYLNDDNSKALRVLQSSISKNNSRNAELYSLMSRIYIKSGDYEKANTVATKAYNYNLSNINTLLTLGDVAYENNKYKQALKYYKQAAKSRSSVTEAKLKLADTYAKLNNTKSSKSIYEKVAKTDSAAYKAFYHIALNDPEEELNYLKKSVAINP